MAPIDSKTAELAKLKNKLLEIEAQLREEKKITLKLRDNSEKKIQLIMALDSEIATELETFKWKKEKNLSDRTFLIDESEEKLISLTERELFLQHTIAEFDFIVYENETLHNMIKEVSHEQLRTASIQAKEHEKKSQRNFDARIEMEDVHRHTIMGFNNEYQKEAISKMELEASQANSENDRIYTEFDIREARTNALIRQQQASYEQLMQARIERDVVEASVQMQEKGIHELTTQNERHTSELAEMNERVQKIRDEIRYLRSAVAEKNAISKQNHKLQAELNPIVIKAKRLHDRVNKLCHKLILEGLEIAKKERSFQSSQIAQRIDGIGVAMSYDRTPIGSPKPTPQHSPNHSTNVSLSGGMGIGTGMGTGMSTGTGSGGASRTSTIQDDDVIFKHLERSPSDVSGFSMYSDNLSVSQHSQQSQSKQSNSKLRTKGSIGKTGTGTHSLALSVSGPLSSYNEVPSEKVLDPDLVWKVSSRGSGGGYVSATAAKNSAQTGEAHKNLIRKRLKELQKIASKHAEGSEEDLMLHATDTERAKKRAAMNLSFSMLKL